MWSLPDINHMNAEAKSGKAKLEEACRTGELDGEKLVCQWHDHDEPSRCEGELYHHLVYSIFSEDPIEVLTLCQRHEGYYGSPSEGYFECSDCNRVHVENLTWERYEVSTDDGSVCLPCYLRRVMDDEGRWIPLTDEAIEAVDFNKVRKAPHAIGVQMPIPANTIRFVNNVEFDSGNGRSISGGGVDELKETMRQLKTEGETRALLILDAAYQFAVSLGLYVPVKGGEYDVKPEATEAA